MACKIVRINFRDINEITLDSLILKKIQDSSNNSLLSIVENSNRHWQDLFLNATTFKCELPNLNQIKDDCFKYAINLQELTIKGSHVNAVQSEMLEPLLNLKACNISISKI